MLTIAEELLLLALHDEEGRDTSSHGADAPLAGALLVELAQEGWVVPDGDRLAPVSDGTPDRPLLADALGAMRADARTRTAKDWVGALPKAMDPIRGRVAAGLVDAGILDAEQHRVLGLFKRERFPERDPEPERELRSRLASALLGERTPAPRERLLLGLLRPAGLVDDLVPREHRRAARQRAEALGDPGAAGTAVSDAARDAQAAVMVATIAATTAATAGSTTVITGS